MFEMASPGIPRLITALSQWLGITVMILLLEKKKIQNLIGIKYYLIWIYDHYNELCDRNLAAKEHN